ncbi:RBBP9/YdeN family alpha/beta hydrolase [Crenobacter cavernae]|uniref:Alpha/beta hydrolase n=1 Tax=Crenobacter cavernae TaxID=2290923 RepID=A0ABY0FBL9_9NEIS|nr:alpha/beta hydrolase [Crenobacter cavernae]RXZ43441.1 alpha/beta hydrolase [Crenobacter cavernae]
MSLRRPPFPVVVQPGWKNSGPEHWQSHWQAALSATRVENRDWHAPQLDDWLDGLDTALDQAGEPALVIAHSLGCIALAHYARRHPHRVAAAILVAPADVERAAVPSEIAGFGPIPREALPFPSLLIASDDDPYCRAERAQSLAELWGSELVWLPGAGHINPDSGYGPWPDGLVLLDDWLAGRHRRIAA